MKKIQRYSLIAIPLLVACVFIQSGDSRAENFDSSNRATQNTAKIKSIIYTPPSTPERKRNRPWQGNGAGSRSICLTPTNAQTLIAPVNHTGLTSKSHPTFSIYFAEVPNLTVRMSVKDRDNQKVVWIGDLEVKKTGISTFSLPKELVGLKPGIDYTWAVAMICDRDDRFQDIFTEVPIKRVEISSQLKGELLDTKNPIEKAKVLAKAGLFYDALGELVKLDDPTLKSHLISSILEQAGLRNLALKIKKSLQTFRYLS